MILRIFDVSMSLNMSAGKSLATWVVGCEALGAAETAGFACGYAVNSLTSAAMILELGPVPMI